MYVANIKGEMQLSVLNYYFQLVSYVNQLPKKLMRQNVLLVVVICVFLYYLLAQI